VSGGGEAERKEGNAPSETVQDEESRELTSGAVLEVREDLRELRREREGNGEGLEKGEGRGRDEGGGGEGVGEGGEEDDEGNKARESRTGRVARDEDDQDSLCTRKVSESQEEEGN
jgi:transcription termination factor Rho